MTTASSPDAEWHPPTAGDVSVMAEKPLCECRRARLSAWNKEGSCSLCQREEAETYFKTVQTIDSTMPRYRIVRVLQDATRPLRAAQIAKMAVVGDNETYRLLRDLVRRGQVHEKQDGLAIYYTYAIRKKYSSEPQNKRS